MRALAALLVAVAAGVTLGFGGAGLLEAWLSAFLFWTQLAVGALGVLAIGHLLREDWLQPVRAPLEAAARTLPLLALMAVPVLLGLDVLYAWAEPGATEDGLRMALLQPWPFRLRAVGYLALWALLGWLMARPGRHVGLSALTIALLLPSTALAVHDWVLSRDLAWFASMQGFTMWVEGLAAALALAILAVRHRPRAEGMPGLAPALLTLALGVLWLWFIQFIVVWMADLPAEAAWYLRRLDGGWGWLQLGLALPALLLAIALAAPPDLGRWRMTAVCILLLVQHVAHLWWIVRPDAFGEAPPPWLDLLVTSGLGVALAAWWQAEHRPGRAPATGVAQAAR